MASVAINLRVMEALRFRKSPAPIRIGVTGLRGIPNVMGGIETHCEQLLPRLKVLRPSYEVIVLGRSPYLDCSESYKGVTVRRVFTIRNKYVETILHTFLSILYARFVLGCRFIHIHGIGPALLTPLAIIVGLKVVVTHHGEDYNREKWNKFARTALRIGEFLSVKYSNAILVVSNDVSQRLRDRHTTHGDRIHYVPNGSTKLLAANDSTPNQSILDDLKLQRNRYVLAVGRLVPEKNFDVLVEAFKRANLNCELIVAGAADHQDRYATRLLATADQKVRFVGFQSRERLAALYEGAALFVLPSSHEGLPIAALEAAAAKCPILLSDIKPNVEIGLDDDNYFAVGRSDILTEKLKQPFEKYRINSNRVLERFDWDNVAQKTMNIYDRVLKTA